MRIQRVAYLLFDSDAAWLDENKGSPFHEIDREILLTTTSGEIFISWMQIGSSGFKIAQQPNSFFLPPVAVAMEYSSHTIWSPLIDSEIEIIETGPELLALEIRNQDHSVYCCPFECGQWGADVLHIANALPESAA